MLTDYEIRAVSGGEDAQGQVLVQGAPLDRRAPNAESATGHGLSTNIIEASLEAYLGALERLVALTGAEDAATVSGARS